MFNICIAFNAGSYGTFIEWCLNYFTERNFPQELLFTESGSSHMFIGNVLYDIDYLKKFIIDPTSNKEAIYRLHPKIHENENIIDNMQFITNTFKKTIFIHPTEYSIIWNINNKFDKIYTNGWLSHIKDHISKNLLGWGGKNLDEISIWELREFLSLYICQQHTSESGIDVLDDLKKNEKVLFVSIDELRDSFKETLTNIINHCELNFINKEKIDLVYQGWVSCQYHKDKDLIVSNIVNAVLNDINFSWDNVKLTLIDEAFVQMRLRKHNINIKCFELNTFPSSTSELKPLLYYAT